MKAEFDVVIVGAGLAGAALALLLEQQDFRVALIDKSGLFSAPCDHATGVEDMDLRVVALTASSVDLLTRVGVWDRIQQAGSVSPYTRMHVWDAEGTADLMFSADEIAEDNIGTLVESRVVVAALHQRIKQSPITVFEEAQLESFRATASHVDICLAGQPALAAQLLVGADGANSFVRDALGITEHVIDNRQQAIVCNVETAKGHEQVARQRFLTTGPLAFLPMQASGQTISSIVWSCDNALAESLQGLNDSQFKQALTRAFEGVLGGVVAVGPRAVFPLVARHSQAYYGRRVALVGDAAHVVHPLAGQGINLGYDDVDALVACLVNEKRRGGAFYSDRVLAKYQRLRRGDTLAMLAVTQGFKWLFGVKALPVRWLRNTGMRRVNSLTALRRAIIARAVRPLGPQSPIH